MNTADLILERKFPISSRHADFKSQIRMSSLINDYIQAAWQHAEVLGVGYQHLKEQGLGWVLSRFSLDIYHIPKWPGEIEIKTWPKGMNRLFYLRDAEMYSDGKKFADITSAWLIFDIKSKRPKVLYQDKPYLHKLAENHAIDAEIPTLKLEGSPESSTNYKIRYNDIDVNLHLTTVRYLDFVFDTYDIEFLQKNVPKTVTVNFLKEVVFGDEVVMQRFEGGNTHSFELITPSKNIVNFRAEITY
jgi:medium-chain acyl-[acyl-carrier-protein] hydrolase